ncbi:MAG: LacI family DNA-binding transcriptional regulator [Planctomycetota bacterium]
MKKVTIVDIARVSGVSKSTVSRVLNGTAVVKPEKRQAVLEATERLEFRPNAMASSLASGRSMTIGVLTQLMGTPFFDAISQGVISQLNQTRYSPIFVDGQWKTEVEIEAIRALLSRRVDAMVLIGGSIPGDQIDSLCAEVPTVIVARHVSGGKHRCIYMDNIKAGYVATKHLIAHGHTKIAIIKGHEHHDDAVDRLKGYQQALNESNIIVDQRLIMEGDFSAESGRSAVTQLLEAEADFTAILAANDLTAFGARLELHQRGVDVPGEISIVGFDDQLESAYCTPPLTTVRQPAREMGQRASEAVLDLLRGSDFESLAFEGKLIERASVAKPIS